MHEQEVIKGTDTVGDAVTKLSQYNPGATHVCLLMVAACPQIDPDAIMPITPLLSLDTLGIRGAEIWMLYKDVCGQNLNKAIGLLRSWQLGIITKADLIHAVQNRGAGIDTEAVMAKVKKQLPKFGWPIAKKD